MFIQCARIVHNGKYLPQRFKVRSRQYNGSKIAIIVLTCRCQSQKQVVLVVCAQKCNMSCGSLQFYKDLISLNKTWTFYASFVFVHIGFAFAYFLCNFLLVTNVSDIESWAHCQNECMNIRGEIKSQNCLVNIYN